MTEQKTQLDDYAIRSTLITVVQKAWPLPNRMDYRLVGDAAAIVRGVRCPANSVEILIKVREDVDRFAQALSSFPCLAAASFDVNSGQYQASYLVGDTKVTLFTDETESAVDTHETHGSGPWDHYTTIVCGTFRVPAVALELRLVAELVRDRMERILPIIDSLQRRAADLDLLKRALADAGLPESTQEEVLQKVQPEPEG